MYPYDVFCLPLQQRAIADASPQTDLHASDIVLYSAIKSPFNEYCITGTECGILYLSFSKKVSSSHAFFAQHTPFCK